MESCPFKENDIVWAKVQGHPWWPAIVILRDLESPPEKMKVVVNFIGEKSHAELRLGRIANYKEKYQAFSKSKANKLKASIQLADQMVKMNESYKEDEADGVKDSCSSIGKPKGDNMEIKSSGSKKKRKTSHLSLEAEITEKIEEKKEVKRYEANGYAKDKQAAISQDQEYLEHIIDLNDQKRVSEEQDSIEAAIIAIMQRNPDAAEMCESKIGISLSRFISAYSTYQKLDKVVSLAEEAVNKLKQDVLTELFGNEQRKKSIKVTPPLHTPHRKRISPAKSLSRQAVMTMQELHSDDEGQVSDPKLKANVSKEIAKLLEEKSHITAEQAFQEASLIEYAIRSKDRTMTTDYQEEVVRIMNRLKQVGQKMGKTELLAYLKLV